MYHHKKALLLDMNHTFMFGEDRFGPEEDFSTYYHAIGGTLPSDIINTFIRKLYDYLDHRYPLEAYRHHFPTLEEAIDALHPDSLIYREKELIIATFAYHEHGSIPEAYVKALQALKEQFILAVVIDIWAPKTMWVDTFKTLGIWDLFSTASFSSDHGHVKPSPHPFNDVVTQLDLPKEQCLVIGDSIRRDLGGAKAAGIDCVLVGEAHSDEAMGKFPTLLAFQQYLQHPSI